MNFFIKQFLLYAFWIVCISTSIVGLCILVETRDISKPHVVVELPVRLVIPKIGVDVAIESVGLTATGALDVPKDPANAALFNRGPRPGEAGSAVIDGHYGWTGSRPAAFDRLNALHIGDEIYVRDAAGTEAVFIVHKVFTYDQNEVVPEVFSAHDGVAHLNLITCEGAWNTDQQKYPGRLVVFADLFSGLKK